MMNLLEVRNLKKYFPIYSGVFRKKIGEIKAVDDISFTVQRSEIVGLVGESGSGKSTAGRTAIRLLEPTDGEIFFNGEDFRSYSLKKLRKMRCAIQMIFQDPLTSLNPRKTVLENIGEALLFHGKVKTKEQQIEDVLTILKKIGLSSSSISQYPHQFSGGQQQRISIGRAIALNPKLIICDEAVSALDLSVQAQILNLLYELKTALHLSYLFISHDLSIIRSLCDRVIVLYRGKIVESGPTEDIFENPKHPYTRLLLSSIPGKLTKQKPRPLPIVTGSEENFAGCPFFSRCPLSKSVCRIQPPPWQIASPSHGYSCIH
jgi:oligopeptide/dipeptide ABC transporter ATP-binding protein